MRRFHICDRIPSILSIQSLRGMFQFREIVLISGLLRNQVEKSFNKKLLRQRRADYIVACASLVAGNYNDKYSDRNKWKIITATKSLRLSLSHVHASRKCQTYFVVSRWRQLIYDCMHLSELHNWIYVFFCLICVRAWRHTPSALRCCASSLAFFMNSWVWKIDSFHRTNSFRIDPNRSSDRRVIGLSVTKLTKFRCRRRRRRSALKLNFNYILTSAIFLLTFCN